MLCGVYQHTYINVKIHTQRREENLKDLKNLYKRFVNNVIRERYFLVYVTIGI